MTITRIFCFTGALALAALIGTSASSYAAQSCCKWVGDKYINLKTGKLVKPPKGGKLVKPPKGTVAPLDEGVTEAKPKPAAPPDPYYRLADRYYGDSDPFHGYYDYHALPPLNPGYGYVRPLRWR
jgi:hypothetical protein